MTTRNVSKAIHANQLEECTRNGWTVKMHYRESIASTMPTQVPLPTSGGYPTTMQGTEAVVTSHVMFVVEKDLERVDREVQLQEDVARLVNEVKDLKNALDKAAVTTSNAEAKAQRAEENAKSVAQELRDKTDRVTALEGQLAKVKRAIGEIQYKEILGLA